MIWLQLFKMVLTSNETWGNNYCYIKFSLNFIAFFDIILSLCECSVVMYTPGFDAKKTAKYTYSSILKTNQDVRNNLIQCNIILLMRLFQTGSKSKQLLMSHFPLAQVHDF